MDTTCSLDGCARAHHSRGYCRPHHHRWKRYGDPRGGRPIADRIDGTPADRFWPKVDRNGPTPQHRPELGPCWIFSALARNGKGYGQFRVGSRMVAAHRFAYELQVGPIPEGLEIDHLCRTRDCVRGDHLEAVTGVENQARRVGFNYAPKCPAGLHAMTDDNVRLIRNGSRKHSIRVCRTCSPDRRPDMDEVCPHGHPRSPENVIDRADGRRGCRPCMQIAGRDYQRRKRAAARAALSED